MSELIERSEHRHMNVKDQDEWQLAEDGLRGMEAAALRLYANPHNAGCGPGGVLYLNGISLKKLEELRDEIDRYLADQKAKIERQRQEQRIAESWQ